MFIWKYVPEYHEIPWGPGGFLEPLSEAVIHCSAKKGNVEEATKWFEQMSANDVKVGLSEKSQV